MYSKQIEWLPISFIGKQLTVYSFCTECMITNQLYVCSHIVCYQQQWNTLSVFTNIVKQTDKHICARPWYCYACYWFEVSLWKWMRQKLACNTQRFASPSAGTENSHILLLYWNDNPFTHNRAIFLDNSWPYGPVAYLSSFPSFDRKHTSVYYLSLWNPGNF